MRRVECVLEATCGTWACIDKVRGVAWGLILVAVVGVNVYIFSWCLLECSVAAAIRVYLKDDVGDVCQRFECFSGPD
ncbi:hypothetical protein [Xylella taiwanensis]|uniref:hypothetical protein n=1 Tax=Xylella taiwanensis TaxID=1444770 RepID=UPI001F28123F|nr:hypothetical protein [Xylella taiwanensis]